jgi:hypothetical protein
MLMVRSGTGAVRRERRQTSFTTIVQVLPLSDAA